MQNSKEALLRHNGPTGWILIALVVWMALGAANPPESAEPEKTLMEGGR